MIFSDKTKGRPIFGCHDARCVTENHKHREERQHRGHAGGGESTCANIIHQEILPNSQDSWCEPSVAQRHPLSEHQHPGSEEHDQVQATSKNPRLPTISHCPFQGKETNSEGGQNPPASAQTPGPRTPGEQVVKEESGRR